jgi:Terpene cyclase DEP1
VKNLYLLLCVLGVVVPYEVFIPWLATHGPDLPLFLHELHSTSIGTFFGADVLVSALALLVWARVEGKRIGLPAKQRLLPLVAVLAVGVSLGLPLFLYLRERQLGIQSAKDR